MDTSVPMNVTSTTEAGGLRSAFCVLEATLPSPPISSQQIYTLNGPHKTRPEPAMGHKTKKPDESLQEFKQEVFCEYNIHTPEGTTCTHITHLVTD